jgi:hypothetical protein
MTSFKKVQLTDDPDMFYQEFSIAKKGKGRRKLVSPSAALKKYQKKASHILTTILKNRASGVGVWDEFHGFIRKRNAITGAKRHIGFEATVMFDFSNFFDTVNKNDFDQKLFEYYGLDERLLFHKKGYTAQGFPSSPALCNIKLIPFVKELKDWCVDRFGKDNFAITQYADDITVSYHRLDKTPDYKTRYSNEWREIRDFVYENSSKHNLIMNEKKTRVRFQKHGWRRILGINVGKDHLRATRKTVSKIHRAKLKSDDGDIHSSHVLGGLRTWSRCILPGGTPLISAKR